MDCLLLVLPWTPTIMQGADGGQCQLMLTDAQDICFCPLLHTHTFEVHKEQEHFLKKNYAPNEKYTFIANTFIRVNDSFINLILSVYNVPETLLGTRKIDEVRRSSCLKEAGSLFGETEL